jgi:hypothetical protein
MASPRPAGLESLGVTRPSPLFALAAALAVSLALGIAPQSAAQQLPLRVGIAVQVIEVEPDPKDQPGLTARVKADVERMLRMSHRKVLTEYHYALPLGKAAHFLLPNGCEGDVTPMAIEPNGFVRLKIEVKTGTTFNLELSVKAGGSFKVGAGRSTHGHLLLSISPRL